MLSLCRQTDGWTDRLTDRQTTEKQYASDLSMRGHKNESVDAFFRGTFLQAKLELSLNMT